LKKNKESGHAKIYFNTYSKTKESEKRQKSEDGA